MGSSTVEAVFGLDPSLTGFAVVRMTKDLQYSAFRFSSEAAPGLVPRFERYRKLIAEAFTVFEGYWPRTVIIEGYSFGSMHKSALGTMEFGSCVRRSLISRIGTLADPPLEAAPTALKKFAIGVGKGDKLKVALALAKAYGVDFDTNDEFDAYGLARMAACVAGWDTPRNNAQREALAKLEG